MQCTSKQPSKPFSGVRSVSFLYWFQLPICPAKNNVDIRSKVVQIVAADIHSIMATKKSTRTKPKGPRGPALRTITLGELVTLLKNDLTAEIQVGRRSVIKCLQDQAINSSNITF